VRYLVQEGEVVCGERLLQKVYENGTLLYDTNDLAAIDEARKQLLRTLPLVEFPTVESELTQALHVAVREKLLSNLVQQKLVVVGSVPESLVLCEEVA
jgi:hypothetical protein